MAEELSEEIKVAAWIKAADEALKPLPVLRRDLTDRPHTKEELDAGLQILASYRSQPSIGHPDFSHYINEKDNVKKIKEWLLLVDELFVGLDQKHFDHIVVALRRKWPKFNLEWKRGCLWANDAKTKVSARNIEAAWKSLRKVGRSDDIEEFLVELISKQLGEIFVG